MTDNIRLIFQDDPLKINLEERLNIIRPTKHNELKDLDYENSGHTGFASSKQLEELSDNTVPRRLNMFQDIGNSDRKRCMLYVDNNGQNSKVSIADMLSKIIRTSNTRPADMQTGEYLFLKKEE